MRTIGIWLCLLLLAAAFLAAQVPMGQLFGVVRDSSGLVVPNADVTVTNEGTGQAFTASTNSTGDFLVRSLAPGQYTVSATAAGFKTAVHRAVTVVALENARVDLVLEVGVTAQSVDVSAEAPLVDTRSGTVGTLIDDKRIVDLPVSGRNMINFAYLAPGVGNIATTDEGKSSNAYNQQRLNMNGNRFYNSNTQLDGAALYWSYRGAGVLMPPPDAMEEVKMISSGMTAEYGRGTVVMSAVTKSGTNELHGSAYDYFRNDALDARGFFDKSVAKLRRNQFGATVGGPVLKNKLFYFISYEGTRIHQDASNTSMFPPTQEERDGNFSHSSPAPIDPTTKLAYEGAQIPKTAFDPVAVKLVNLMPLPNSPSGRLSWLQSQPSTSDNVVGKMDYTPRQNDRISLRYYFDYLRAVSVYPNSGMPAYAGVTPISNEAKSLTLNQVHIWSPLLITTTHGSFTKFVYDENNAVHTGLADLGATNFVDGCSTCQARLPFLLVGARFEADAARDQQRSGPSYDFGQDWSFVRGKHELKWGAQTQRILMMYTRDSYSSGRFTFDGSITKNVIADLMLGRSSKFTQNTNNVNSGVYYIPAFYAQDTWKAARRLTLTLGLRWEIYTPWRDDQGQMATYIAGVQSKTFPGAPLGTVYQTDPQYNYNTDFVNIGPRIGFAWDVFGDGKMAVRGGFGVSYDGVTAEAALAGNQPFSYSNTNNNPGPLSNPYANMPNPYPYVVNPAKATFTLPATVGTDTPAGLQAMYNYNLNLSIARQLSPTWSVQSSYVGNLARKMLNYAEANPAIYGPAATTKNTDARRPLAPTYTSIQALTADGNSAYHSWQTVVTKRLSHGLSVLAHYTWSKGLDTCTSEVAGSCVEQDPANRNGSRALNDYDHAHNATISYLYSIPFLKNAPALARGAFAGWQLAGIHRLQTGAPFTVLTGSDVSLSGVGYDRPNVVGDWHVSNPGVNGWFNGCTLLANGTTQGCRAGQSPAWQAAPSGRFGNVGRNTLRAPGFVNWDLSISKEFPFWGERRILQLRTDFLNILNHPNFDAPKATLSSPSTMGVISSTVGSARIIQLALRAVF